jgi:hypothetical protein
MNRLAWSSHYVEKLSQSGRLANLRGDAVLKFSDPVEQGIKAFLQMPQAVEKFNLFIAQHFEFAIASLKLHFRRG